MTSSPVVSKVRDIVHAHPELTALMIDQRYGVNVEISVEQRAVYPGDIVTIFKGGDSTLIERARLKPLQRRAWRNRRSSLGDCEPLIDTAAYEAWIARLRWARRS